MAEELQKDFDNGSIGSIIKQANNLSADQVEQILKYQRDNSVKFGEAAVALGLADRSDVLWALSQQFHYQYAGATSASISSELVLARFPFSEEAEIFRDLRSQLVASVFEQKPRPALAIVSSDVGDGKSFFAANLAVALSQLGGRTLLLDADMRTPRLQQLFNVENAGGGLSGILSGRHETNVIRPIDDMPSLYLLPVGVVPPNPLELVQGKAFDQLLQELRAKFDYVVVDTPAASHGADARAVSKSCGAALLIGRKGRTKMVDIEKFSKSVIKSKAHLAGVLLNEF